MQLLINYILLKNTTFMIFVQANFMDIAMDEPREIPEH